MRSSEPSGFTTHRASPAAASCLPRRPGVPDAEAARTSGADWSNVTGSMRTRWSPTVNGAARSLLDVIQKLPAAYSASTGSPGDAPMLAGAPCHDDRLIARSAPTTNVDCGPTAKAVGAEATLIVPTGRRLVGSILTTAFDGRGAGAAAGAAGGPSLPRTTTPMPTPMPTAATAAATAANRRWCEDAA